MDKAPDAAVRGTVAAAADGLGTKSSLTCDDARDWARKLELNSLKEWQEAHSSGSLPATAPLDPVNSYPGSATSWQEWVGANRSGEGGSKRRGSPEEGMEGSNVWGAPNVSGSGGSSGNNGSAGDRSNGTGSQYTTVRITGGWGALGGRAGSGNEESNNPGYSGGKGSGSGGSNPAGEDDNGAARSESPSGAGSGGSGDQSSRDKEAGGGNGSGSNGGGNSRGEENNEGGSSGRGQDGGVSAVPGRSSVDSPDNQGEVAAAGGGAPVAAPAADGVAADGQVAVVKSEGDAVMPRSPFLSYEESREWVRGNGVRSAKEWREMCRKKELPANVPPYPHRTYKNEWISWGEWLGTGTQARVTRAYLPFEEAQEWACGQGLKNQREWFILCKSSKLPYNIPTNPNRTYKDHGWVSWGSWLGHKPKAARPRPTVVTMAQGGELVGGGGDVMPGSVGGKRKPEQAAWEATAGGGALGKAPRLGDGQGAVGQGSTGGQGSTLQQFLAASSGFPVGGAGAEAPLSLQQAGLPSGYLQQALQAQGGIGIAGLGGLPMSQSMLMGGAQHPGLVDLGLPGVVESNVLVQHAALQNAQAMQQVALHRYLVAQQAAMQAAASQPGQQGGFGPNDPGPPGGYHRY